MENTQISVKFPDNINEKIVQEADTKGLTKAAVVKIAVSEYFTLKK
ncbi:MAG: hypothetical protein Q8R04_02215 [Nanoarchaeota archaeon]|nr:hypothetical protein [Nanoarchaeota archaeon]